jgi:hypothetical protein
VGEEIGWRGYLLPNFANLMFVWKRFSTNLLLIEIVVLGLVCVAAVKINRNWLFKKPPVL